MEQEILKRLDEQQQKLDEIQRAVRQMRRYFLIMLIGSVAMIILPLIGLAFVIPQFLSIYSNGGAGL